MRERHWPRTIGWLVCLWLLCCLAAPAGAQLDKGHRILLERGFQIQATAVDQPETPNWTVFDNAGWNAVDFAGNFYGPASYLGPAPGNRLWTAWYHDYSHTSFSAAEAPYASNCVAIQLDDEQNLNDATVRSNVANWFAAARPNYPNTILHINQIPFAASDAAYRDFMVNSRPDMLMIDSYRWVVDNSEGTWNLFSDMQRHRKFALSGHDGTGARPIPYGIYPQAIKSTNLWRVPSESELRVNHFAAWGLGYKLTRAFTYNTYFDYAQGIFLKDGFKQAEPTPSYFQVTEINRQGTNLGPALVRLLSKDVLWVGGRERDAGGNVVWNPQVPIDMNAYPRSGGPYGSTGFNDTVKDPYIRGVGTITNLGTRNDGLQGDVLLTWFQVLDESFDGPASGEWYFMITNALVDPTGSAADCQQQITLNFDTGYSGVSTLQRLRRSDGQLEIVPLTPTTARQYQLQFTLEGGTGDLFKYNDGSQFVGFNNMLSWDNNGGAAGIGGAGTWDAASEKWHNGSSHGPWVGGRDAVFAGSAGNVMLASPQSVNSLTFETNGYAINGSTLTMAGQAITTDAGVSATIASTVAGTSGVIKAGAGTLALSNAGNTYTGGTTITGGALQIAADGAMGPAPATFTAANIILNDGTLRFADDFDIANTRGIDIGPGGGTIDTQSFSNPSGYNAFQGGFRGPGDLTKLGSGTFYAAAPSGGANTTWKGRLIIKEGTWKIFASDGLPYNVPAADGLQAAQVTLDGGTWQMAATRSITNTRRGITVEDGGGTIDTQNFDLTWAGPIAGTTTTSTLTKTGAGILRFTGVGTASTYNGNVHVAAGTLRLDNGNTMGDLASILLAAVPGTTLNVTGNETIGSISGGGGNVTIGAGATLTTGANNTSTTFAGTVAGAGGFNKSGTGTLTACSIKIGGALGATGGTLAIASNGGVAGMIEASAVSVAAGRSLDMNDNDMIVNYALAGPSPEFPLRDKVLLARDGMTEGIFFTRSGADDTILAFGEASELAIGSYNGVAVDGTTVIGKYTYYGDANLDGQVTTDDYVAVDLGLGTGDSWVQGDFDLNGVVTTDDYVVVDLNLGKGTSNPLAFAEEQARMIALHTEMFGQSYVEKLAYASEFGWVAASVPEPGALSLVGLAIAVASGTRRRRVVEQPSKYQPTDRSIPTICASSHAQRSPDPLLLLLRVQLPHFV